MDVQELVQELLEHARGMWRYRWHLIAAAWLVAAPAWAVVYKMPDVYEASAQVSVDTNSLLPKLTQGLTASENLMDEVSLVSRALLTRPNLSKVARETDLDLRANTPQEMELLITGLQERVKVKGGFDNIFVITYQDPNRQKATEVVASLLNTLVESSLGAKGDDAEMTERALRLEIDDHEERLLAAEAALAEFKKRNIGYMPDDGVDYYSRLQAALDSVGDTNRRIRLLRERRDEIARQLEGEEPVFGLVPTSPTAAPAATGCSKAGNIAQLEVQLADLQVDFTDKHPRIVMLKETIAAIEQECVREREALGGIVPVINAETNSLDANPVYQSLRLQLSAAEVELVELSEEYATRRNDVRQLRADVDKIAEVEAELKRLNRDYGVVESRHEELLKRWETLQSKKRLDPVTEKVQFNILEPPFSTTDPVAPNRPFLLIAVLVFALGVGGAIAFGLNQLKPVFFHRRALSGATGIPVLGSVSMIMSASDRTAKHRRKLFWVAANVALLFVCGLIIVFDQPILGFLRDAFGGGV